MLKTIQLIAFLQGIFLLLILFKNKEKYQKYNYIFFSTLLVSLIFYIIGDDNNNLFLSKYDLFFVDKTLFITLLFLFLKNFNKKEKLNLLTLLYFVPVCVYVFIEIYELQFISTIKIEFLEHFLSLIFIIYLIFSLVFLKKLAFNTRIKLPFFILIISVLVTYLLDIKEYFLNLPHDSFYDSLLIFEISIIFYYLTYFFVFNYNFFDIQVSKYKNSSLNIDNIEVYKTRIIKAMKVDKIFTNQDLTLQIFSNKVDIPKHFISEILSVHLKTNFQDFINQYRVEEFIKLYTNSSNNHFSIFGLATSVGFKSKATFNANFKKFKGISPTEYKQSVL